MHSILFASMPTETCKSVMPRFPKYVETEAQRASATYIREENTPSIYAMPKVT